MINLEKKPIVFGFMNIRLSMNMFLQWRISLCYLCWVFPIMKFSKWYNWLEIEFDLDILPDVRTISVKI